MAPVRLTRPRPWRAPEAAEYLPTPPAPRRGRGPRSGTWAAEPGLLAGGGCSRGAGQGFNPRRAIWSSRGKQSTRETSQPAVLVFLSAVGCAVCFPSSGLLHRDLFQRPGPSPGTSLGQEWVGGGGGSQTLFTSFLLPFSGLSNYARWLTRSLRRIGFLPKELFSRTQRLDSQPSSALYSFY